LGLTRIKWLSGFNFEVMWSAIFGGVSGSFQTLTPLSFGELLKRAVFKKRESDELLRCSRLMFCVVYCSPSRAFGLLFILLFKERQVYNHLLWG